MGSAESAVAATGLASVSTLRGNTAADLLQMAKLAIVDAIYGCSSGRKPRSA